MKYALVMRPIRQCLLMLALWFAIHVLQIAAPGQSESTRPILSYARTYSPGVSYQDDDVILNSGVHYIPILSNYAGNDLDVIGMLWKSLDNSRVTDVFISKIGCAQSADLNTGNLYGTSSPATDAAPCINAYLDANVIPGKVLMLHQDGASVSSGIFGPAAGGWGIVSETKPGIAVTTITGCVISANVLRCATTANSLVAGQAVILNGFPISTFLNTVPVLVLSADLSRTKFKANFMHADATVEAGTGQTLYGNGFYQKAGSNNDMIHNGSSTANCPGGYMDPGYNTPGPPPPRGSRITLLNLMLNGNRGNGRTGNSTTGSPGGVGGFILGKAYCYYVGVNLMNVNEVVTNGNYFYNQAAYNERLMNVGHVEVNRNVFDPFGPGVSPNEANLDGLHIDGPAEDIHADSNLFRSGDDAWALNAPEGWVGPIANVSITNSRYDGALSGGRMYTNSTVQPKGDAAPTISHVIVSGGRGNVQVVPFIIGNEGTITKTVSDTMWDVKFVNNDITLQRGAYTCGVLCPGNGIVISENIKDISFIDNVIRNIFSATSAGYINTTASPTVHLLTISGAVDSRSAAGHTTNSILNTTAGYYSSPGTTNIGRLNIHGAKIVDSDSGIYGPVGNAIYLGSCSRIEDLFGIDSIDYSNIKRPVDNVTRVKSFHSLN